MALTPLPAPSSLPDDAPKVAVEVSDGPTARVSSMDSMFLINMISGEIEVRLEWSGAVVHQSYTADNLSTRPVLSGQVIQHYTDQYDLHNELFCSRSASSDVSPRGP